MSMLTAILIFGSVGVPQLNDVRSNEIIASAALESLRLTQPDRYTLLPLELKKPSALWSGSAPISSYSDEMRLFAVQEFRKAGITKEPVVQSLASNSSDSGVELQFHLICSVTKGVGASVSSNAVNLQNKSHYAYDTKPLADFISSLSAKQRLEILGGSRKLPLTVLNESQRELFNRSVNIKMSEDEKTQFASLDFQFKVYAREGESFFEAMFARS